MDVRDFNAKLASARKQFREDNNELRNNYRKHLQETRETHDAVQKNQFENYQKHRIKTEKETSSAIDKISEKSRQDLNERTQMFTDKLRQENISNARTNQANLDRYNERLSQIKGAFDSAQKENMLHDQQVRDQASAKYENDLKNREREYNKSIQTLEDNTHKQVDLLRYAQDKEKRDMNIRHSDETNRIIAENSKVKNLAKNLYEEDLNRVKKGSQDQITFQKDNAELRINNLRDAVRKERDKQNLTHEERMISLEKKNVTDINKINSERSEASIDTNRRIAAMRQAHQKQLNSLREVDNSEVNHDHLIQNHKDRINHFRAKINENNEHNNKLNKDLIYNQQEEIKRLTDQNNREKIELAKVKQKEKNAILGETRKRFNDYDEKARVGQKRLQKRLDESIVAARRGKMKAVNAQRLKYEDEIKRINESNDKVMESIKKDMAKEQTQVIEKIRKDKHATVRDLKEVLTNDFEIKEISYQKRLASKDHEIEMIKAGYETKIDNIKAKVMEELEMSQKHALEKQEEDRLSVKREMKAQQFDFDKKTTKMRNEFDKKIMNIKGDQEIYVTKLITRYEDMIGRERAEFVKDRKRQESLMKAEVRKVMRRGELERDALVKKYEVKLAKLREANRLANQLRDDAGRKSSIS